MVRKIRMTEHAFTLTPVKEIPKIAKRTSREVVEAVIKALKKGPKSIYEVAGETGTTWESVRKYLEMLREAGMADETEEGNKRVFSLKSCMEPFGRKDTLFGLPLSPDQENTINFLFMEIRKTWKEKTGSYPGRTQMQKILVDVADECKLDVPSGWYKYGQVCVKLYDPSEEYHYQPIEREEEIAGCINRIVEEKKNQNAISMELMQYAKSRSTLYLKWYEFEKRFEATYFSEEKDRMKLRDILSEISFSFKGGEESERAARLLNDFLSAVIYMLKNMKPHEIDRLTKYVNDASRAVWNMVAIHNLFWSLSEKGGYKKAFLMPYFALAIKTSESDADDCISVLRDLCGIDAIKENEFKGMEELLSLRGSVKEREISREERRKWAEEFAKEDTSDIFRKLGLD